MCLRVTSQTTRAEDTVSINAQIVDLPEICVAGLACDYNPHQPNHLSDLWVRLKTKLTAMKSAPKTCYGVHTVVDGSTGKFRYLAGIALPDGREAPRGMRALQVPQGKYAMFEARVGKDSDYSSVREVVSYIWQDWLPSSQFEGRDAPEIERYNEDFNYDELSGTVVVGVPVAERGSSLREEFGF